MTPYRNMSLKTAAQRVRIMKALEERMWRKWGGGEEASARWPERKLRRRPRDMVMGEGEGGGEVGGVPWDIWE